MGWFRASLEGVRWAPLGCWASRSGGTPAGTTLVKEIGPGAIGTASGFVPGGTGAGYYFAADDGAHGTDLWW